MKRNQGITLIETLIILVILILVSCIAYEFSAYNSNDDGSICKSGYKFTGRDARASQILDSQGHGIPCDTKK